MWLHPPLITPPAHPPTCHFHFQVALGRLGAYVATDVNAWDFGAGQLVVEETAGGTCSDHTGAPLLLTHRNTLCSSSFLHPEVLGALGVALAVASQQEEERGAAREGLQR
jgi:3'-phosphoadenosine 5'-phosphosulfate (PAPS) 3'-phosphatase